MGFFINKEIPVKNKQEQTRTNKNEQYIQRTP